MAAVHPKQSGLLTFECSLKEQKVNHTPPGAEEILETSLVSFYEKSRQKDLREMWY